AMEDKLKINMERQWPEPKDGEPRLHIKEPGNSPVIPDGWVMVPKQVTPEISNAINVVGQRCTCGNCSQRLWDLLLDATQQGVNRG
ncbi:dATP/dGTP pyrophosphohydrolase domain-containing protein, partial [Escherichia coli]|uniref:dATP/dGTP pyrophosphohydrolase domain-containing protein n=1 Tax=Escherichia coli TaxID=562 RepID=UPI0010CBDC36